MFGVFIAVLLGVLCVHRVSAETYRESIENACQSLKNNNLPIFYDTFLAQSDVDLLINEILSTYSEKEARSSKHRSHSLGKVPILKNYIDSFLHTSVLPAVSHRFSISNRLLGIKSVYFEIQSIGVKKSKEILRAASKKNTGDFTFVTLLQNNNRDTGVVEVFNMTTIREDTNLDEEDYEDVNADQLFDNEDSIISRHHNHAEHDLIDTEKLKAHLEANCSEDKCIDSISYGPLTSSANKVIVDLSVGEGIFFSSQRYYRISPVNWAKGTDPAIYLVAIFSVSNEHTCAEILNGGLPVPPPPLSGDSDWSNIFMITVLLSGFGAVYLVFTITERLFSKVKHG